MVKASRSTHIGLSWPYFRQKCVVVAREVRSKPRLPCARIREIGGASGDRGKKRSVRGRSRARAIFLWQVHFVQTFSVGTIAAKR